jgi:FkbM family methyltransferase
MMGAYTKDDWPTPFYTPNNGDVVADVGANVGLFPVWLKRRAPECRVVALEPFLENFRYLRANLEAIRARGVAAHRLAIGSGFGKGKMNTIDDCSSDYTLSAVAERPVEPRFGTTEDLVEVVPLAALFDLVKIDRFTLLKVDVEGSEYDVGANEPTLRRFDRIAIEYPDHIRPGTLEFLQRRLEPTHHLTLCPSGEGFGMLYGVRCAL